MSLITLALIQTLMSCLITQSSKTELHLNSLNEQQLIIYHAFIWNYAFADSLFFAILLYIIGC